MTTSIEVDKITRGLVKEAENLLRQKWESNRLLVDFLEFLNSKKIILAKYGCDVDPEEREHYSDELVFACRRGTYDKLNLVREFLGLETYEESVKKADQMLAEIRRKNEIEREKEDAERSEVERLEMQREEAPEPYEDDVAE